MSPTATPDHEATFALILVMAGRGERFGGPVPKAFVLLDDEPLWLHAQRPFSSLPACKGLVLVVPPDRVESLAEEVSEHVEIDFAVVAGGARRQDSVRLGVAALEELFDESELADVDVIAVHDGARPLVESDLVLAVVQAAQEFGAALAAVPALDTVKEVSSDHFVFDTPDRRHMWQAQTPQCFRRELIRRAHDLAVEENVTATDDAALVESLGLPVRVVRGGRWNLKVTEPSDLAVARTVLALRRDAEAGSSS